MNIQEMEIAAQSKLEPEALFLHLDAAARLSLAISMKRIADALSYQSNAPENLYDLIREIRSK